MKLLELNLKAYFERVERDYHAFLTAQNVKQIQDLPLGKLESFCQQEEIDFQNLLTVPMYVDPSKAKKIKLLILDIDGVMTDAGMFFTENGDQFKKYNAKDGMAVRALADSSITVGIISSGFKLNMVKDRADLLKIERVYVGRDPKVSVLQSWCDDMGITFDEVCIIGDDINDLEVMKSAGFSACPADAVNVVKQHVDLVLQKKGGKGCVREFIDYYLMDQPLGS
jgi:YrbI family 3-deoxy-D-manno-octulosonate 8-phosphate phosphatase